MIARALLVWLLLLAIAFANGALREGLLVPRFGAAAGHVVSTALLAMAILAVALATIGWLRPRTSRHAAAIGALWAALVLAFEFGFGRVVAHKSWPELCADYNLAQGRVWTFIPIITAAAPYLAARARRLIGVVGPADKLVVQWRRR